MRHFRTLAGIALAAGALLWAGEVGAAVVISEGFSYGGVSGSLAGKSGGGEVGLAGSWAVPLATVTYEPVGLTFRTLFTGGGDILIDSTTSGAGGAARAVRNPTANYTGSIWGSYLVQLVNGGNPSGFMVRQDNTGWDYGAQFTSSPKAFSWTVGDQRIGTAETPQNGVGTALSYGGVYLVLFKVTNLGGSGNQVGTSWFLSPGQFSNFKANLLDTLTETELNAAGLGTADNQVMQRMTVTANNQNSHFLTTDFVTFALSNITAGQHERARFDELRISDTSLDETVPIMPEPTTLALLALGGLAVLSRRRR